MVNAVGSEARRAGSGILLVPSPCEADAHDGEKRLGYSIKTERQDTESTTIRGPLHELRVFPSPPTADTPPQSESHITVSRSDQFLAGVSED